MQYVTGNIKQSNPVQSKMYDRYPVLKKETCLKAFMRNVIEGTQTSTHFSNHIHICNISENLTELLSVVSTMDYLPLDMECKVKQTLFS